MSEPHWEPTQPSSKGKSFWALAVAGSDGSQYVRVEEEFAQNALSQNGNVIDWSSEQGLQCRVNTIYDQLFKLWHAVGNAYQQVPNWAGRVV